MTPKFIRGGQLPVVLPPAVDELLSSWIIRHALFYDVPPLVMLRHCMVDMSSLRALDLRLTEGEASRVAEMLRTDASSVHRLSLANFSPTFHRFIATKPVQFCAVCSRQRNSNGSEPTRRSQLLGWRLSCSQCGASLTDNRDHDSPCPFADYWTEALNGQRLIDDEAERGVRSWGSPMELARLLLMRRDPRTGHSATNNDLRLLGLVVPEIDALVADRRIKLPSPASPILPLWLRPALLAAVSLVERQGPAMLAWLQSKTIGQNRTRFSELAAAMLAIPTPLRVIIIAAYLIISASTILK